MLSEFEELRASIAKLPDSDRYLLAEMILNDIRAQREARRQESQQAMSADVGMIRTEEAAQRNALKSRSGRTRAAG